MMMANVNGLIVTCTETTERYWQKELQERNRRLGHRLQQAPFHDYFSGKGVFTEMANVIDLIWGEKRDASFGQNQFWMQAELESQGIKGLLDNG